MNIEAWIALGTFAFVIGSAIVALAMRIAGLHADATNRDAWIKSEVQARKDADEDLEERIKQERDERVKKDSDVLGEVRENRKRMERWERRQIELGRKPPHDTPDDEEEP